MKKIYVFCIIFSAFFLQANSFELQVSVTNETCPGNGNLQFTVTGQTSSSPFTYYVYLLPNTQTPVVTTNDNNTNVQVFGNYLVVASQVVNGVVVSAQSNASVSSSYIYPQISLTTQSITCLNDGQISVVNVSGNIVSYQLLTGPVTTNYQSSNIFSGLPVGTYTVRAIDVCGNTTVALANITLEDLNLSISAGTFSDNNVSDCGFIKTDYTIDGTLNSNLYPLTIVAAFQLPSGGTSINSQVINNGDSFSIQVPVNDQNVSLPFSIVITTNCGSQILVDNNIINFPFNVAYNIDKVSCTDMGALFTIENGKRPYTFNFLSAPSGFNPLLSNNNHPGPFNSESILYSPMPDGNYLVSITDNCGKNKTLNFDVEFFENQATVSALANGCTGNGNFCVELTNPNFTIVSATLLSGPPGFSYPFSINSFIVNEKVCMNDVPIGDYSIQIIDECGTIIYKDIVFTIANHEPPSFQQRPSCDVGLASIAIGYDFSVVESIEIISAPNTFMFSLPYDVSFNIAQNGNFYMSSLPEGQYIFKIVSNCGYTSNLPVFLDGLDITANNSNIEVQEICGGFNLNFNHISNGLFGATYFLQKYNPLTDSWGHPITGVAYNPLSPFPTNMNSLIVQNGIVNPNIPTNGGQFRILKAFFTYTTGSEANFICVSEIGNFVFEGGPKFIDAFKFPCANNTQDVVIVAEGLEPLHYRIVEKNGVPFLVDNGTQNSFLNLSPGTYKFEFEDVCGFIRGRLVDLSLLNSPTIVPINLCPNENGSLQVQGISFINYKWYKQNTPTTILSTTNSLNFVNFNPQTDSGIYIVELTTDNANSCINTTIQYEIKASDLMPNAGTDVFQDFCVNSQIVDLNLLLSPEHDDNGVWADSNGNIINSTMIDITNFAIGNYVYHYKVNSVLCSIEDVATITLNITNSPTAPLLIIPSKICRNNDIQILVNQISGATYNWTGPNGFSSNISTPTIANFQEINDGVYTLNLSVNGCIYPSSSISIISSPSPLFNVTAVNEICTGQNENISILAQNYAPNLATYNWYFNGEIINNANLDNLSISNFGTYLVEVVLDGCSLTKEIIVTEKTNSFDVNLSQTCSGTDYSVNVINAADFPNATFLWNGPNNFTSTNQNLIIPKNNIGTFNLQVTNSQGCRVETDFNVTPITCEISNFLSPNADGVNDLFDLTGLNVKKLSIYNRYGCLVFEKENYLNEWFGQNNNGGLLPESTYYYILEFDENSNTEKNGWVFLSR